MQIVCKSSPSRALGHVIQRTLDVDGWLSDDFLKPPPLVLCAGVQIFAHFWPAHAHEKAVIAIEAIDCLVVAHFRDPLREVVVMKASPPVHASLRVVDPNLVCISIVPGPTSDAPAVWRH